MIFKNWNIEETTGYKPLTTSYMDLSIAEAFGLKAIKDTIADLKKNFKGNYKYETELIMALNWKIWEHYETNELLGKFYNDEWGKMDEWFIKNYDKNEKALKYFYQTTD